MSVQLKDVFHFYYAAPMFAIPQHNTDREYQECRVLHLPLYGTEVEMRDEQGLRWFSFMCDIKPRLIPFEKVSRELAVKVGMGYMWPFKDAQTARLKRSEFLVLIRENVDLFELVESGQAIDATLKNS